MCQLQNAFIFFGLLLGTTTALFAENDPPLNILFVVADDLGWADLACYGSDLHETPHLDALANRGIRFTNAYAASPVCTPTRASLLTGQHPARLQMTIWREAALSRGNRRLLQPICLDSLPPEKLTIAELLKEKGYYNVHLGKWHVGRAEAYPQVHGFHRNIGGTLWGAPQTFWYPYSGDQYFSDWRYVPDLEPSEPGGYLTDALTDKAIEVMQHAAGEQRPFFINLWYHTVHTPIEGKPALVEHYEQKVTPQHIQRNPHYAAMVHSMDQNVGRLLEQLDELGVREQTLVVFTSDNGGFINHCKLHRDLQVANNSPLRSGKGSCYEGGIRIPMIVSGPDVASGRVSNVPAISCDWFPTLMELADLDSAQLHEELDGVSLAKHLKAPASADLPQRELYFHYPHYYLTTTPVSAIRRDNWKLLHYYEDDRVELYDLDADVGESRDRASAEPKLAEDLKSALQRWRERVGALEPESNPEFEKK